MGGQICMLAKFHASTLVQHIYWMAHFANGSSLSVSAVNGFFAILPPQKFNSSHLHLISCILQPSSRPTSQTVTSMPYATHVSTNSTVSIHSAYCAKQFSLSTFLNRNWRVPLSTVSNYVLFFWTLSKLDLIRTLCTVQMLLWTLAPIPWFSHPFRHAVTIASPAERQDITHVYLRVTMETPVRNISTNFHLVLFLARCTKGVYF